MSELERVELELLELVGSGSLDLKCTVDKAAKAGELLSRAKEVVPHGQFKQWIKRCGLAYRTASDYMVIFREVGKVRHAASMTIRQFLEFVRNAKFRDRQAERKRVREEVAKVRGRLPDRLTLVNSDCRRFDWPELNVIATDPPWGDMDAYRWLAGMASDRLRDGGLALVMTGSVYLHEVMDCFRGSGLSYRHCLAVVYNDIQRSRPTSTWIPAWRPILVFTRGKRVLRGPTSDAYTIVRVQKRYHDWEQSPYPWRFWLERLTSPDELVADPFAGSGTSGVVCHELGLRWVGTEVSRETYRTARGRLRELVAAAK